jgi:DNA-binding NtrC family response regulator
MGYAPRVVTPRKSYCIIIVEEDDAVYRRIVEALQHSGCLYHVRRVRTQEEMEEELLQLAPDFVICDHSRCPWNSFAVLEQVRAFQATMPFAVIGGGLDDGMLANLRANGVDACVDCDRLGELVPAVEEMLHRREEQQRQCVDEIRRKFIHENPARAESQRDVLRFRAG